MHRSYRYRCRHCISRIRSRHHFKQNAHVRNRSRHRPNHANPGKRADACGKVAGGRNSSRRRLQTAYAAEVRRHANRAAAIAAHSACRASRRNGCRFAAAGGSSGGEATAIASGCSAGGVGSDGGGSVRVPAHFCGICGLKPTPGRIPATGHFPAGVGAFSWIGVVGLMSRTIADVRALFEVMAGPDPGDALSAPVPLAAVNDAQLKGLRVGVLESDALGEVDMETAAALQKAANDLATRGFVVEPMRLQGLERAIELWWFFFGPAIAHLFQPSVAGHEDKLSRIFREYLQFADAPVTLDALLSACAERDVLRANILRQMRNVPILLSPVSTTTAFRHGEGTWRPGAKQCYRDTMRFSQWLNLTGFPGASVPVCVSAQGLPIGVQVIGRPHEEELVLAVAERIENGRGPWLAPEI